MLSLNIIRDAHYFNKPKKEAGTKQKKQLPKGEHYKCGF
jgi:hypothetical protein